MSDRRHATRATLPAGYQFGDGRFREATLAFFANHIMPTIDGVVAAGPMMQPWRAPHENAGEQLTRQQRTGEDTV